MTEATVVDDTVDAGTVTSLPGSRAVVYDAIAREAYAETMAGDFDLTWHSGDNSFLHVKAGWTRATGDTLHASSLETSQPASVSYALRARLPPCSFPRPPPPTPP